MATQPIVSKKNMFSEIKLFFITLWKIKKSQNLLFRFLQNNSKITVNLFYKKKKIIGNIIGFDEFMNLVLNDAVEILEEPRETKIGRVLIRGDSIVMIHESISK